MIGKIDCSAISDIGKVRSSNEDQFLIADLFKSMLIRQTSLSHDDHTQLSGATHGQLMLVADGMGGKPAGERASALAVDAVTDYILNTMPWFLRLRQNHEDDLKEELRIALVRCQSRLDMEGDIMPERRGLGTTLTMAYLLWPRLYIVHVGDSRCYVLRQGKLEQVTIDHTVAQQLVDRGGAIAEEVPARFSHMLWNYLGGDNSTVNPEVYKAVLKAADVLLLCTDGLTGHVGDDQIKNILQQAEFAHAACQQLVETANADGGKDNITVVVARFLENNPELIEAAAQSAESIPENAIEQPAAEPPLPPVKSIVKPEPLSQ